MEGEEEIRKFTTKPPPRTVSEVMAEHVERYWEAKDKEYVEAAKRKGLTINE